MIKTTFEWKNKKHFTVLKAQQGAIVKATVSAINKTVRNLRTAVERALAKKFNIKRKDITRYSAIKKANRNRLSGKLGYEYRRRTWRFYGAKVVKRNKKPAGLRARVYKKGPKFIHPRGFFMERSGVQFALFRESKGTIKRLTGPSVPQLMTNRTIDDIRKKTIAERYKINYDAAIKHFSRGIRV